MHSLVTKHTALAQPKEWMQSPCGNTKQVKPNVHTLSQKYKTHVGTSPGLWRCTAHLLCSEWDEPHHTQGWSQDTFGGLRRQGHVSCYSLAARAQVQEVQAATGTSQQMERTAAMGRALLLLSTTGSVERD